MKRCPRCMRTQDDAVMTCDCGVDLSGVDPVRHEPPDSARPRWRPSWRYLSRDFRFLAFVGRLLVVLAWVGLGVSLVWAAWLLTEGGRPWFALLALLGGIWDFVLLYALSEAIRILVVIREEVRRT